MEALALVGVISSIVTLVDFGSGLLSDTIELHKSTTKALTEHKTTEQLCRDLVCLTQTLRLSMELVTREESLSENEKALERLGTESIQVANKLLGYLETFKSHGKHKSWGSMRQAFKVVTGRAKVEGLTECLEMIKQHLTFAC